MLTRSLRLPTLSFACSSLLFLSPGAAGQSPAEQVRTAGSPPEARVDQAPPDGFTTADWTGIQSAFEVARLAARPVDGGFLARNPGQRWKTTFDGRGSRTEPDGGGWSWGLELKSYGFAGDEQGLPERARARAEGGRVVYKWSEALDEWYVNESRGLEHGFTVHRRPPGTGEEGAGPLTFEFTILGTLRPRIAGDGRGVAFLGTAGQVELNYGDLHVFDADDRELGARFESRGDRLELRIDERGARYPLTVDPVAQQAYIKASNSDSLDHFGSSVAMWGDTLVVGASGEASAATGVNGDQSDNSLTDAGAVYVFVRNGATWSQQAYLKASNPGGGFTAYPWGDFFGCCVSIWGDTLVVGAYGEASSSSGVNGDESDNSARHAGAAYVFVRNGTTWSQQAYLKASNPEQDDKFGTQLELTGDTIVVGAYGEDSAADGVNGNQSNNSATSSGAAYVFVRNGATWSQQAYLKASNSDAWDSFGSKVAISGNTVVVGAWGEDSGATGVNGDESDNSTTMAGAAYVFVRNGTTWNQQAYLKGPNTAAGAWFGYPAISGDTLAIGAPGEANYEGAAYVFVGSGSTWNLEAQLKASNPDANDSFGVPTIAGDTLVINATYEESSATGVNGDQSDNSMWAAGAAYLFVRVGTTWVQEAYLKAFNTDNAHYFGNAAVWNDTVAIGATGDDSDADGVDGDIHDNSASSSGAVFVFDRGTVAGTSYCYGDPGSGTPCPCNNDNDGSVPGSGCANGAFASGARLSGSGSASVSADSLVLTTTGLHPNNTGLYFQGNNHVNSGNGNPFGDGLRCAGGGLIRLQIRTANGSGTSSTTIAIGAKGGVSPGQTKRYQCWYRDTSGAQPCGVGVNDFNLSNGYEIAWLP